MSEPERILFTGSRDWPGTWESIGIHLPESEVDATIIHGACERWRWPDGQVRTKPGPGAVQCSVDMMAAPRRSTS